MECRGRHRAPRRAGLLHDLASWSSWITSSGSRGGSPTRSSSSSGAIQSSDKISAAAVLASRRRRAPSSRAVRPPRLSDGPRARVSRSSRLVTVADSFDAHDLRPARTGPSRPVEAAWRSSTGMPQPVRRAIAKAFVTIPMSQLERDQPPPRLRAAAGRDAHLSVPLMEPSLLVVDDPGRWSSSASTSCRRSGIDPGRTGASASSGPQEPLRPPRRGLQDARHERVRGSSRRGRSRRWRGML